MPADQPQPDVIETSLLAARARLVHDLNVTGQDTAEVIDVLDGVVAERRWWVENWPAGADLVAGQVAQDLQERMLDGGNGRWPLCEMCDEEEIHELSVEPELGPDPQWVCERSGTHISPVGDLRSPG